MSNKKELKPTSFAELQEAAKGELVELPPFTKDHPFVARMVPVSLMTLIAENKIPNSLLPMVNEIFNQSSTGKSSETSVDSFSMIELVDVLGRASFLEPTWDEIKESGVQLTSEQYTFIINYTQGEITQLQNFREEREVS